MGWTPLSRSASLYSSTTDLHLFVDISSHGFGHLAITAPVLEALAASLPELRLTVRSRLPPSQLQQRIAHPFELIADNTDFGFAMIDATQVDQTASALAYQDAHAHWLDRVTAETGFLKQQSPDFVLTNVSYLPLAGATLAGIPCASLCSLNWADLFQHFFGHETWAAAIHRQILDAYQSADAFLRVTPGMAMSDFPHVRDIAPIAARGLRHSLPFGGDKAVLVAMGGIAHRLPVEAWPSIPGIRWLVSQNWRCTHPDAIAWETLGLSFTDLLASVDTVITKPGYGTFTEAVCNGTPVLYQRREDWPEQECLIAWLERHGQCAEIEAENLICGDVEKSLSELWQQPCPEQPVMDGAAEAAAWIRAAGSRGS